MTSQIKNEQKSYQCGNSENNDNVKNALSGIMASDLKFLSINQLKELGNNILQI